MTTEEWTLILMGGLILFLAGMVSVSIRQVRSRSSTPPSPTPTSTPSTPSESLEMAKMMMTMASQQMTQVTKLMETMMVGREQPEPSPTSLTWPQTEFDPESTPLSPGIEAVLSREVEEDQLEASLKERAVLQGRMREILEDQERQMDQSTLDDLSPGPWSQESASENLT